MIINNNKYKNSKQIKPILCKSQSTGIWITASHHKANNITSQFNLSARTNHTIKTARYPGNSTLELADRNIIDLSESPISSCIWNHKDIRKHIWSRIITSVQVNFNEHKLYFKIIYYANNLLLGQTHNLTIVDLEGW